MQLYHVKGNTWYLEGQECIPLFRIDSRRCILLDAGRFSQRDELRESLEREGLIPVGVLASHSHDDHTANMFWLKEYYGAKTCLPQLEAAIASTPLTNRLSYANLPVSSFSEAYTGMTGIVDEVIGSDDGEIIFCGIPFQVIHTPGHSPDHICAVTPDNVCYLADTLMSKSALSRAKLPFFLYHRDTRASMEKIRSKSFDVFLAAHTGIVDDLPGTVDANLTLFDSLYAQLLSVIKKPISMHEIVSQIVRQKQLLTSNPIKAAGYARHIQSAVDYLVDTGRVKLLAEYGVCLYAPL